MDAVPITKKLIAFGSKKIYLPKFTVALLRTPDLSPYHARFLVPLDFSKYDLRDYLYHAYNVKCFNIRSYVKQMPVRDTREQPRHWFRPESKKYMTVELEQPFVWPEVPDLEPWGKKQKENEVRDAVKANGAADSSDAREAAKTLRQQVQKLLQKNVSKPDREIQMKKAMLTELTPEEKEADQLRRKEEANLRRMSRLNLWAKKRTEKVVESDKPRRYAIKV
jgi:large subunit ribosomal protein L23